jgi:hypothetical protein
MEQSPPRSKSSLYPGWLQAWPGRFAGHPESLEKAILAGIHGVLNPARGKLILLFSKKQIDKRAIFSHRVGLSFQTAV